MLLVNHVETEAESKRWQGEGIANQRKAIITGLKDSVEDSAKAVPGSTPQDVMQLVFDDAVFRYVEGHCRQRSQQYDSGAALAEERRPDLFGQIRNAITVGTELASHSNVPPGKQS